MSSKLQIDKEIAQALLSNMADVANLAPGSVQRLLLAYIGRMSAELREANNSGPSPDEASPEARQSQPS